MVQGAVGNRTRTTERNQNVIKKSLRRRMYSFPFWGSFPCNSVTNPFQHILSYGILNILHEYGVYNPHIQHCKWNTFFFLL